MKYKYEGEWKDLGFKAGDTLPIGSVLAFGGLTPPSGWLICDGAEISRTTYKDLFDVIGTYYGTGDGETTFSIPNLQGRVLVGKDRDDDDFDELGNEGGEKTHTLTKSELPQIDIQTNFAVPSSSGGSGSGLQYSTTTGNSNNTLVKNINYGGQAHNNLQPYTVTNYIIKAYQSVGVVAKVEQDLTSNSQVNVPSVKAVKEEINNIINYSGEEHVVGKWLDGKKIYRKCFVSDNVNEITTGITNIDSLIKMEILVKTDGQWRNIPWLWVDNTNAYGNATYSGGSFFMESDGKVYFQTGSYIKSNCQKVVLKMEYTKN